MIISYRSDGYPDASDVAELYDSAGLRRPTGDFKRIESMLENANLIVSAWDGEQLVGIARSLTDFSYACYLSDLAVRKSYQKMGIGKQLIDETRNILGPEVMILLLSAPEAMDYYPKVGFEKVDNAFWIKREK